MVGLMRYQISEQCVLPVIKRIYAHLGRVYPEGRNWPLDKVWTNNNAQEYISKQNRQEKVKTVHAPITVAKRKISNYTQRSLSLQLPTNEKLESFQV